MAFYSANIFPHILCELIFKTYDPLKDFLKEYNCRTVKIIRTK